MKRNFIKTVLVFMLFFPQTKVSSQGITNQWNLGYGAFNNQSIKINFQNDSLIIDSVQRKMSFLDLNASICDSHGNMLFYTNGGWIANATNDTMQNGDNLAPGPYASQWKYDGFRIPQGAVIVPFPEDSTKFYLFHETVTYDTSGLIVAPQNLFASIIDMSLNNGLGAVTSKNQTILSDTLFLGNLSACKHANGRDWWVITNRTHSNFFYKILVTPQGIQIPDSQSIGARLNEGGPGQSCFSPNGKKYARYMPDDSLNIYDFDRCSGLLSNPIHIPINDGAFCTGLAFSPNSRYLYISSQNYVYQFDANDTNVAQTKDTVAIYDNWPANPLFKTYFYLAQLAPNGKIYITAPNGVHYLHVINYPDSAGSACNLIQHGIDTKAFNAFTIPNHPNYFLRVDSGSVCDTLMLSIHSPQSEFQTPLITLFPNPAQKYFFINSQIFSKQTDQFILYNSFGEVIIKIGLNFSPKTFRVATDNLQNGIYFWKFQNQAGKLLIINE